MDIWDSELTTDSGHRRLSHSIYSLTQNNHTLHLHPREDQVKGPGEDPGMSSFHPQHRPLKSMFFL